MIPTTLMIIVDYKNKKEEKEKRDKELAEKEAREALQIPKSTGGLKKSDSSEK